MEWHKYNSAQESIKHDRDFWGRVQDNLLIRLTLHGTVVATWLTWWSHFKCWSTNTPSSLKSCTWSIRESLYDTRGGGRLLGGWINIVLVFMMFSTRPSLDIQKEILDIAEFNLAAMSSTLVPVVKIVVPSANSAEATGAIDCGISLMTMENNVGPSTEPCIDVIICFGGGS